MEASNLAENRDVLQCNKIVYYYASGMCRGSVHLSRPYLNCRAKRIEYAHLLQSGVVSCSSGVVRSKEIDGRCCSEASVAGQAVR